MIREVFKVIIEEDPPRFTGKYGENINLGISTSKGYTSYPGKLTRDELKELKREINKYLRSTKTNKS